MLLHLSLKTKGVQNWRCSYLNITVHSLWITTPNGHIFQDTEYIRSHYNVEDFIYFNYHQWEDHGHLYHFALNPIFHHYAKHFMKEILRLSYKTCLYYPIYPQTGEGKVTYKLKQYNYFYINGHFVSVGLSEFKVLHNYLCSVSNREIESQGTGLSWLSYLVPARIESQGTGLSWLSFLVPVRSLPHPNYILEQ